MQTKHESILRAINSDKKLNILTYAIHESWQSNLALMPHTFYMLQGNGVKNWDNKYRQMPENHILLDGSPTQVKLDMKFDLVFNQNKAHYDISRRIAEQENIPLVTLEHTLPFIQWTKKQIQRMTNECRGQINCYISRYSCNEWGDSTNNPDTRIVEHGIDTNLFKPSLGHFEFDGKVLTVVNDWPNRDWCCGWSLYREVIKGFPANPLGNSPGFSSAAKDTQELVRKYQNASVFLNTSLISPVPMALMEAMSCGCAVVSTNTCMIPEIIEDGVNGFLFSPENPNLAREKIDILLRDQPLRRKMGENARKTISERFSLSKHLEKLNTVFTETIGRGFNG